MDQSDSIDPWNTGTVDGNWTRTDVPNLWSSPWDGWVYGVPGQRLAELAPQPTRYALHVYLRGGRGGPGPNPLDGHTSDGEWTSYVDGPAPETEEDAAVVLAQHIAESYSYAPDDDQFVR